MHNHSLIGYNGRDAVVRLGWKAMGGKAGWPSGSEQRCR